MHEARRTRRCTRCRDGAGLGRFRHGEAVEAGYFAGTDVRAVEPDLDFFVDALERFCLDSSSGAATGASTLGRLTRPAVRQLNESWASKHPAGGDYP